MNDVITKELLDHYFEITGRALEIAHKAEKNGKSQKEAEIVIDMAQRYYDDAKHFLKKNDYVLAFGALYYAHGWLDAGARLGLFKVNDNKLFTVD